MKKSLKIWLITWASLFATAWARAWLTKLGVIPNRFDIEILCPRKRVDYKISDLDWEDPDCNKKCYEACELVKDEPLGYLCWNDCISQCRVPSREKCVKEKCPDYNPDELFWYCDECWIDPRWMMVKKPIIYLYPTIETEIKVKLWNPERLSHTYPKYNSKEWRNVIAQPNGDLVDLKSWRELYSLYREWVSYNKPEITEWFVVKWEDTISFLEEKLAILWLNEYEAEEFIIYRLPQMENNKRNLIHFETMEEINKNMPLSITPVPDSVIRIMMDWKVLDEYVEIAEQEFLTPERTGFAVVERWWSKLN